MKFWLPVFCLLGAVVAAAAAVGWYRMTHVEATALIRVYHTTDDVGRVDKVAWKIRRDTQVSLLRSQFVIMAAVQQPGIKELSELRDVPREDVVEAVRSRMKVSTEGDSEIIKIKLTGKNPEETVELLDAILDAYVKETVVKERGRDTKEVARLQVRTKVVCRELAEQLGKLMELQKIYGDAPNVDVRIMQMEIKHSEEAWSDLTRQAEQLTLEINRRPSIKVLQPASVDEG